MEIFLKTKIIKDKNNRKGVELYKDTLYWKAWFHKGIQRWDLTKYGEKGQNFEEWIFNDEDIKFIIIVIPRYGRYQLEMKEFREFYIKNPLVRNTMFRSKRFLFPLSLCTKKKANTGELKYEEDTIEVE